MGFLNLFRRKINPKVWTGYDPPFSHDGFYSYTPTPFPHPGTGNLALNQRTTNPAQMIQGHGLLGPANAMLATSPEPDFVNAALVFTGLPDSVGMLELQGLVDQNEDPNGG